MILRSGTKNIDWQQPFSLFDRALRWLGIRSHPLERSDRKFPLLSKTKYLVGLQCSKALWIHYNNKALLPAVDARLSAMFDQGHQVGHWAKKLFPAGKDLGHISGFEEPVEATRRTLSKRKPIFEASFIYNSCFSRADILVPTKDGRWDIIEVKSSGAPEKIEALRPVHLQDLAFQRYVYEGAGLAIRNCCLLLVNKNYVRSGEINPRELLTQIDVTQQINAVVPKVHTRVEELKAVLALPRCPQVKVSPHCFEPYDCALMDSCWDFLPKPSVFDLRHAREKSWDLLAREILRMEDVPPDVDLTDTQLRQVACHRTGRAHVNRTAIKQFLSRLEYPLRFLDFETVRSAVPIFDRSRPFTPIPFQFSLHVVPAKEGPVEHHSFLAEGQMDPRPALLSELRRLLAERGSIIGYNTAFELSRLADCASYFPEYAEWVRLVSVRFVDLLDVFRAMWYYHPSQNGSASLKAVLPALTARSYEGLEIDEGELASREFMRIMFSRVGRRERRRVRRALEEYCAQDTSGLIDILAALEDLVVGATPNASRV